MEVLESSFPSIAAFIAGVAAHLFIFRIGEWDLAAVKIIVSLAVAQFIGFATLLGVLDGDTISPLAVARFAATLGIAFVGGIFGSMLVYRGFFHRLKAFPGPFLARFSNLYATGLSVKNNHLYEEVQKLHKQYGDYVRLGLQELSINNAAALAAIHGNSSICSKGSWYNVLHPMISINMVRDKQEHIRRRRIWDRGFNGKALRDYEPRVLAYTNKLLEHFEETAGEPVNVTDWFNFYSFDIMGDLTWGKSFNMLRDGVKHYFMTSLHEDMKNLGLFSHMLWLFPIVKMVPDRPDVFSWLLEDYNSRSTSYEDKLNLDGDAYTIAVAGSDTTAAVLTCLFFELARQPNFARVLQNEVDQEFESGGTVDSASLGKLPYLNAVINETMRLHPPVPSGVQRITPSQGLKINDVFIPGNTIVQVPSHSLFRDGRYFDEPDEFIPDRWTAHPEMVKDASVYTPFSIGRYSCIGKQLGLMELRYVVSQIVRKYDVALAPGQSAQAFIDAKCDAFTLAPGSLNLIFSPRLKNS